MGIAKEIYEIDGFMNGSKYVLTINEDNSVQLEYYEGSTRIVEPNVEIVDGGNNGGKRLEFGTSTVKSSFPFKNYNDGKLDSKWTRIL